MSANEKLSRKIVAIYLMLQSVSVAAWWLTLIAVPTSLSFFQPSGWPKESLLGFWLADSVLLIAGSMIASVLVIRNSVSSSTVMWGLAAAIWYPTLYCVGVSVLTDESWIASAMMVTMAGLTLVMATIIGNRDQQPAAIRVTPMSTAAAVRWTLGQTLVFWSVCLWILPKGMVELERLIGWEGFSLPYQTTAAALVFIAASSLGLSSGLTMAMVGNGTPLPTATAPQFVVRGPYRYVRNPMAVAGIIQGIAVGWYLGSYSVIAYSIAGAIVWHCFVRPVEETDLLERFGERYLTYQQTVGLWIPVRLNRSQAGVP